MKPDEAAGRSDLLEFTFTAVSFHCRDILMQYKFSLTVSINCNILSSNLSFKN